MTWSYSWDQLLTNPVYAVRLLIGDVISCQPQLQDEEIAFHIGRRSSLYGAASECCRSLAARFARSVDFSAGSNKASYSQLAKAYTSQALLFEAKAATTGAATPYSGGTSIADMLRNEANGDRVLPAFTIGMQDDLLPVAPTGQETETEEQGTSGST